MDLAARPQWDGATPAFQRIEAQALKEVGATESSVIPV